MEYDLPSSDREMRVKAEKERRDRLKKFTDVLATLLPSNLTTSRKLDKTSILRLSANYITLDRCFRSASKPLQSSKYSNIINKFFDFEIEKIYNMFFISLFTDGKILYVSDKVDDVLGYHQAELLNEYIYKIIPKQEFSMFLREINPITSSSSRRTFTCHMIEKGTTRSAPGRMMRVIIQGRLMKLNSVHKKRLMQNHDDFGDRKKFHQFFFVAVVSPSPEHPLSKISLSQATKDEYFTRHLLDGRIIDVDHRISTIAGYLTRDVIGGLALDYMTPDDKQWITLSLSNMVTCGDQVGTVSYKLLTSAHTVIYLRTQGFVQKPRFASDVPTMVCINTLIDADVGEKEIRDQRIKFECLLMSAAQRTSLSSLELSELLYDTGSQSNMDIISFQDPNLKKLSEDITYPQSETTMNSASNSSPSNLLGYEGQVKSLWPSLDDKDSGSTNLNFHILQNNGELPTEGPSQPALKRNLDNDPLTVVRNYEKPMNYDSGQAQSEYTFNLLRLKGSSMCHNHCSKDGDCVSLPVYRNNVLAEENTLQVDPFNFYNESLYDNSLAEKLTGSPLEDTANTAHTSIKDCEKNISGKSFAELLVETQMYLFQDE